MQSIVIMNCPQKYAKLVAMRVLQKLDANSHAAPVFLKTNKQHCMV